MTKAHFLSKCQDGLQYVQSGHQTPEQVLIVIQQMLEEHLQLLQQTHCTTSVFCEAAERQTFKIIIMTDKIKLYERQEILNKRVHKLEIIQKDIYPFKFNVVTKLINKNEKKITIINKILSHD